MIIINHFIERKVEPNLKEAFLVELRLKTNIPLEEEYNEDVLNIILNTIKQKREA